MSDDELESLGTAALMRLHRASLFELYRRGVVRTLNAPQGDWAELLVVTAYGGSLAPNSVKSYDVLDADGRRLQVKSRAIDHERVGSDITSPFRSFDFDAAVIVDHRQKVAVCGVGRRRWSHRKRRDHWWCAGDGPQTGPVGEMSVVLHLMTRSGVALGRIPDQIVFRLRHLLTSLEHQTDIVYKRRKPHLFRWGRILGFLPEHGVGERT